MVVSCKQIWYMYVKMPIKRLAYSGTVKLDVPGGTWPPTLFAADEITYFQARCSSGL